MFQAWGRMKWKWAPIDGRAESEKGPASESVLFQMLPGSAGGLREYLQSRIPDVITPSTLKTARESAVAGYRGLLWPFKIRRMAATFGQWPANSMILDEQ